MTKRPSKLELYTCCTLVWVVIAVAAFLLVVSLAGGPRVDGSALALVWAVLFWRKDIEVRQVRWASEQTLLLMAEGK